MITMSKINVIKWYYDNCMNAETTAHFKVKCKEGNDWLLLSQFVGNQRSSDSWETEGRGHQGKEKHRSCIYSQTVR